MSRNPHLSLVLTVVLSLASSVSGQSSEGIQPFGPDKPVEREISGGESHSYRIALAAGQFARFRVEQTSLDCALLLSAPDGKQLAEADFTATGEQESLAIEAATAGDYQLTVRSVSTWRGSYRLEATVQASASAQDKKYLAAQLLMLDSVALQKSGGDTSKQALEKLQQALAIWRELQEPSWYSVTLDAIGSALADAEQEDEALKYYEQALASARESKLRAREAAALAALSQFSYETRDYEKSAEYSQQALVIQRELKNRAGEGITLNDLGVTYNTMRRADRGIPYYEQALAIKRELKDRVGECGTLHDVGWAYLGASRSEEASASFEQSVALARELKDRHREDGALSGLGILNQSLSRYEKAISYFEQTLVIERELKDRYSEGMTLAYLSNAYGALRRYDKYFEYAEQSLAISRETRNRVGEGRTLSDMGGVYLVLGRLDKATECLEPALVINREQKDRMVEGFTLRSLGGVANKQGQPAKAIEYYEQALTIFRDMKSRPHEASTLNMLAQLNRSQHQYDKAIENSEQALALARDVKNPEYELNALQNLAWTENDRGNLETARSRIEEALKVAESLRSDLVSPTSRASLLASVQTSYQLYTDILMRQNKAEPGKGFDALAVEVSERQRARSLLDLLVEAGADLHAGVDPALIEREQTLAKQLSDKARQRTDTPEAAAKLKLEISQLETDYERAQVAIRENNPHYAALLQPRPLKLKEIQQQLDPDTLMLEYALGANRSYLWAITRDSLKSYELPRADDINKSALEVYGLLTARSTDNRAESPDERARRIAQAEAKLDGAAAALSKIVLAPAAAELGNKRLVVVSDGALQYIPFAMLPAPAVAVQRPLVVDHEVVSLPSASALSIQRAELAGRQPAPKTLAVIADPVFDRSDVRVSAAARESGDKRATELVAFNDARSIEHYEEQSKDASGTTARRLVIPRLEFTRLEAQRLIALAPRNSSLDAIDFRASRATVLSGDLSQYRYVHFATHGMLDSERPGLSSLVLSMVDADGKPEDGFLRANDIYNLKLPAELVVLSACQTGLGKEVKGEGMIGLTRGFMYAGAARVVVSLWNVNDRATADLMARFYEKMLKQGERPAAALRAAQVEMWRQKQWRSPYFWSAFVLQGEWR